MLSSTAAGQEEAPPAASSRWRPTVRPSRQRHGPPCHAHSLGVCKTENPTRDTTHGDAPPEGSSPVCRKRPFTTQADRLRSRLEGGRLPVAGPTTRRPAGRGRRRRQRLPRLRDRCPRRPPGTRQLHARAPSGRRCSSSGSSPASAASCIVFFRILPIG